MYIFGALGSSVMVLNYFCFFLKYSSILFASLILSSAIFRLRKVNKRVF